jgi:putative membrane protein
MIYYNPRKWFSLIFQLHRSDTFRILLPSMVLVGLYTALVTYLALEIWGWKSGTTTVHSLLGVVLGLVLVFRTNTAYERWWEGRKLWGTLVNETRSLAIKLNAFLPESDVATRRFFAHSIANYVQAVKDHLRREVNPNVLEETDGLTRGELRASGHVPNRIAASIYRKCNQLYAAGQFTGDQLIVLDKEIKAFTDVVGACERIKNTPIPYSYSIFMKKFIFIFTMTMPLGFITTFAYWDIPVVMFVFYVLVSLELIAEEIEDPFGKDANDLPMEELSVKIRQNVRELLGVEALERASVGELER